MNATETFIKEENGGTEVMMSKCLRDEVMSTKIPEKCGLMRQSACYYCVGSCGSGKSFLVESLFKSKTQFYRVFDSINLVCPRSSRSGYKQSYAKLLNPMKVHEELNMKTLELIKDDIMKTNTEGDEKNNQPRFSALVIDDCASDLRNKQVQKTLLKMVQNHRHQHLSIFIISQNFQMLHKSIRDVMSVLIQFKTNSIKEVKAINEEYLPDYSPKECDDILYYIFKDKYQFLLVNRRERYICKSFNPLSISTARDRAHEKACCDECAE